MGELDNNNQLNNDSTNNQENQQSINDVRQNQVSGVDSIQSASSPNQEPMPEAQTANNPMHKNPQSLEKPKPMSDFGPDTVNPNPTSSATNLTPPQNNNQEMVGLGGSSFVAEEKNISWRKVTIVIIGMITFLVLLAGGYFIYRYYLLPPSDWEKKTDEKTNTTFYMPECSKEEAKDLSTSEVYAKRYLCVVASKKSVFNVAITKSNSSIIETPSSVLNGSFQELTQQITVTDKKETEIRGYPAIEYTGTMQLNGATTTDKGKLLFNPETKTFVFISWIGNSVSDREYNLYFNNLKIMAQ